jgi:hypothetical protein
MATTRTRTRTRTKATSHAVLVWQDDPMSGADPIEVPAPDLAAETLPANILGRRSPSKIYPQETAGFRYWAGTAALGRGLGFWSNHVPKGTSWQVGRSLPVRLDDGVDLNAYYTRRSPQDLPGLHFFHGSAAGETVYSGESPDVVCHELGHAVLDAIRPQLWSAMSGEVAAFHESFGDLSALLSALQVPQVRAGLKAETNGDLRSSSRVSRLAEQLGWAIRLRQPDAVDPDCLRNAVNSFFYRPPETLPPSAPATSLSAEPHSFSRLFTGAFWEAIAGMLATRSRRPRDQDLVSVSQDAGAILVEGILAAPVSAQYYSQVAIHMLEADRRLFRATYSQALMSAFVRRGILSLETASAPHVANPAEVRKAETGAASKRAGISGLPEDGPSLPLVTISGQRAGLGQRSVLVQAPTDRRVFPARPAMVAVPTAEPADSQGTATSFFDYLVRRGRIDFGSLDTPLVHPHVRKTHFLTQEGTTLVLVRRLFDCGLDPV